MQRRHKFIMKLAVLSTFCFHWTFEIFHTHNTNRIFFVSGFEVTNWYFKSPLNWRNYSSEQRLFTRRTLWKIRVELNICSSPWLTSDYEKSDIWKVERPDIFWSIQNSSNNSWKAQPPTVNYFPLGKLSPISLSPSFMRKHWKIPRGENPDHSKW